MTNKRADHSFSAAPPPATTGPGYWDLVPPEHPDVRKLIDDLAAEVEHLKIARDTNRRIGLAMGIVMSERQIDDGEAFAVLARLSQNMNRKLRDVAEDVIRNRHT